MTYVENELRKDPALRRDVEAMLAQMRIVQDLAALRQRRKVSQKQIADALGISQQRVAKLESGQVANLELRTIVRMAAALGARVRVRLEVGGRKKAAKT
jgi:transcriptional regulator with XRE-family HTH domain